MLKKILIGLFLAFVVWKLVTREEEIVYGPGVLADESPRQSTPASKSSYEFNDYKITPLADFDIEAKVLAKRPYRSDRESDLSPVDLVFGWGRMSDESVLEHIEISQSGRWYRWRVESFPIPKREIVTHSANMHLIPSNPYVADQLNDIRKGSLVRLTGQLIRADAGDGWRWASSLTREDSGAHACELIMVQSVELL